MITAEEARKLAMSARASLNMIHLMDKIGNDIEADAKRCGLTSAYFKADDLFGSDTDRTYVECAFTSLSARLNELGYATTYDHNGINIAW